MQQKIPRIRVKKGYSSATDEAQAVAELVEQIQQPDTAVIVFFASSNYNLARLGQKLALYFQDNIIGCTTSGEITPDGYAQGTITGVSIASAELQAKSFLITSLQELDSEKTRGVLDSIQNYTEQIRKQKPEASLFGMLLVDGLSIMEEQVIAILANCVGEIPIVGGSAGDDFKLEKTCVFVGDQFFCDAALFTIFHTTLPFKAVKTQHFVATDQRLVITKATPEKRIVHEINGRPAAEEYARVIGLDVKKLEPMIFSAYPVMLRFGGEFYVRSIQKINEDGSLTFFCAIDEGLVLRVAEGKKLPDNLEEAFEKVRSDIPNISLTIGFDCILRLLEVKNKNLEGQVNEIFKQNNVIGFNTYGEQYNSVHVNQTFTGVVLGE